MILEDSLIHVQPATSDYPHPDEVMLVDVKDHLIIGGSPEVDNFPPI